MDRSQCLVEQSNDLGWFSLAVIMPWLTTKFLPFHRRMANGGPAKQTRQQ